MRKKNYISEPSREIPIVEEDDVIVCGGGPAGICAAIAAARRGLKTRLIESQGCLGGILTSGMMSNIIDYSNKKGIIREIISGLEKMGAKGPRCVFDIESAKYFLEKICMEAGVAIRLHTSVTAAIKNERNMIEAIVTESKSGREAWKAKVFIDCTGDGDLAALAGCGFDVGREENGEVQPMSMSALIYGTKASDIGEFLRRGSDSGHKDQLLKALEKTGNKSSYSKPTLFQLNDEAFLFMANHEYNVPADNAEAISKAEISGRAEIRRHIETLKSSGNEWKDLKIGATSSYIGVREGRRIHGLYKITVKDMEEGKEHPDAVCKSTFSVDIHSTNPEKHKGYSNEGHTAKPYDIPLRALITKDVNNLMMAGRCISGDFYAHASYRVVGNAAAMGEAAGYCAALAAKMNCMPQEVPWIEIAKILNKEEAKEYAST